MSNGLPQSIFVAAFLITAMALSIRLRKLTWMAALTGGLSGWIIYLGAGIPGLLFLAIFFLLGTLATSWKKEEKNHIDPEGAGSEKRKPGQVLANAGVATILALAAILYPQHARLFLLMISASFASATADTLSSELGMIYGRRFYNSLSWKKDNKGMDGVVSREGTLIGIAGASVIAGIDGLSAGWGNRFPVIVFAGVLGNFADSILGATLERKRLLGNDAVNFISTAIAALVAGLPSWT
jgi:uncharacterized protein (TIGR00297 family)